MASPFHVFRKHQRVILVVVGLLAIISFVFLGPIMDSMGGRTETGAPNPIVVSSDYGDLTSYDVERLRMLQSILYSFLNQADEASYLAKGGDPATYQRRQTPQISDKFAIHTFLLAGRADEMGIVVDDAVITSRLLQLGLSETRIRELLADYRFEGGPMTTRHLYEAYRTDLKASRVRQAFGVERGGPPAIYTPAESFESYCKLNELVQIESVAVPVESFISEVKKEPSESELRALFDKYKDQTDGPVVSGGVRMPYHEPGFKQQPSVQIQYLEANYLAYLDLAKQQITDEEIAKYYEDNKRNFEKVNLLDAPGEKSPGGLDLTLPELDKLPDENPTTTPDSSAPESSPESAPTKEGTKEPKSNEPESKEPTVDEKPAAEEKPTTPEEKTTPAEPAADEKPAEAAKPAAEGEKPAEAEPQSFLLNGTQTQFVSLQADAEGTPAANAPAAQTPATEKPASETPAADSPAAETPASETPAEEKPAEAKPASADGTPPEPSSTDTSEADLPAFKTPSTEAPAATGDEKTPASERGKEYKPLAEVADEIRQTLADQRAGLSMLAAIEPLQLELQNYWKPKVTRKLKANDKGTPMLPEGFLARAEKANMVFHETNPEFLTLFNLEEIPVGQAGVPTGEGFSQAKVPLVKYAFSGQMEMFEAVLAEGDDGNKYIAWKVGEKEERVPEFAEVKDEVIRAWKMIEARPLAEAEAKRIAEKAKKQALPLDKALGDEELSVLFSQPFSWATRGHLTQFQFNVPSRLSEINGIVGADYEFMKKIFRMKEGEIEVIENFPKTTYYVVRLAQKVVPPATLRENYLKEERSPFFLRPWDMEARNVVQQEVYSALMDEVKLDAHVVWDEDGSDAESDAGN
jgi:hypothetical protein